MTEGKLLTPAETLMLAADEAQKILNTATEQAKIIVDKATASTTLAVDKDHHQEEKLGRMLTGALREVFGENEQAQRFVDVKRIPLICKSIFDMHDNIEHIKEGLNKKDEDHESRIRAIERNMWKWMGVLVIVPPIVTILIALFLHWMTTRAG